MAREDGPEQSLRKTFQLLTLVCIFWSLHSTQFGAQAFTSADSNRYPSFAVSMSAFEDSASSPCHISGLRDIVDQYDVFLIDMWGVLHNGCDPYSRVLDTIQQLRRAGKRLIILSNSSKKFIHSVRMLRTLGFDDACFEQIITSGQMAFDLLQQVTTRGGEGEEHLFLGDESKAFFGSLAKGKDYHKCFVLGNGDNDEAYCEAAGWDVTSLNDASLIVTRGALTVSDGTSVAHKERIGDSAFDRILREALSSAATMSIPMLVSNPDKIRPGGDRPFMPGTIGDMYEEELSRQEKETMVFRLGKPFVTVYNQALRDVADRSRSIMIGDSLETDITGAHVAGIDSLWVLLDGIHGPDINVNDVESSTAEVLRSFREQRGTYADRLLCNSSSELRPTMTVSHFQW